MTCEFLTSRDVRRKLFDILFWNHGVIFFSNLRLYILCSCIYIYIHVREETEGNNKIYIYLIVAFLLYIYLIVAFRLYIYLIVAFRLYIYLIVAFRLYIYLIVAFRIYIYLIVPFRLYIYLIVPFRLLPNITPVSEKFLAYIMSLSHTLFCHCFVLISYLRLCVCKCIVVSNTYCVVFLFCLFSSCVPYAASFSGLSIFDWFCLFI
jgi:hypothetical protein